MGTMDADLPTLDWLAGVLTTHADAIGRAGLTVVVTMPGSPIERVTDQVSDGAAKAFGLLGANLRDMSDAIGTSRNSYEDLDAAFEAQLRRYTGGERPQ